MRYEIYSHRHGVELFETVDEYRTLWTEIQVAIESISDLDLILDFEERSRKSIEAGKIPQKSLSYTINDLLKTQLSDRFGWASQSPIFSNDSFPDSRDGTWRLDFAKQSISVEVAFNHQEAIAHNLIKPVLASELNHVRKEIQTSAGVVIAATAALKAAGGFDPVVGTFEKFKTYLMPYQQIITVPMVVVGLKAPETFRIELEKQGARHVGSVNRFDV